MVALILAAGFFAWQMEPYEAGPSAIDTQESNPITAEAPATLEPQRGHSDHPVFPYSVIPGGIQSAEELQEAVVRDPVVAQHYADFDLTKAHVIHADSEKLMYVSYRIDNRISWTTKQLKIAKGETLITDGRLTARTRCGNMVSSIPQMPISPSEPKVSTLDTPEPPEVPGSELLFETHFPTLEPLAPSLPTTPPGPPPPNGGDPGGPPIFFVGTPPPDVAVPEPGTLLMLGVGIASVCGLRKRSHRNERRNDAVR